LRVRTVRWAAPEVKSEMTAGWESLTPQSSQPTAADLGRRRASSSVGRSRMR
jgi:hypothetical protein